MALSVCCATADPARAAGALGTLRSCADEIVVAVDVAGGEGDIESLLALADRVFEIELGSFPEPALAWLHEQCSGEWIMRLDDDEVPSASLLERLPELLRARDVLQYWLARRWLYPDREHWIDSWPWFPDFQGRLVRNDPHLWCPGLCHSSLALVHPARYLESALYHADLLICDRAQRESRVSRYLSLDPSLRAGAADSQLPLYLVPELHPGSTRAPVALEREDSALIDALLSPSPKPPAPAPSGAHLERVSQERLHARWAARELAEDAYRASIRPVDLHRQLVAGEDRPFRVSVRNEGSAWWPGDEERRPLIRLAYSWLGEHGETLEREGTRTALPQPLAPGDSCVVAMNVTAPPQPGRFALQADLVHEYVRWFRCRSQPIEMLVRAGGSRPL